MASLSGTKTNMAVVRAGTWGTAEAASTGDKFIGELTWGLNETTLKARSQGSGKFMTSGYTRGAVRPSVTLTGDAHFQGAFGRILSQFMGAASISAELNAGQGDYRHTFTMADQSEFLTIAAESSSSTVIEFPTCSCRSLTISTPSVPGYLQFAAEFIANKLELSTSVNTNAVLAASTLSDSEIISPADEDDHWIDTQASGSLASGDQFNIINWSLQMLRPQDSANEIKGSAGNGSPTISDDITATLTITTKDLIDHAMFAHHVSEAGLKALLLIEGSQIGSGALKSLTGYVPRMQLIKAPSYGVVSPGMNPVTYTFDVSGAASNPTGMSSLYPYFALVNGLATGYLA